MMRAGRFNSVGLFAALCVSTGVCGAQYRVLPGQANEDGCLPKTGARICLGETGTAHCYTSPSDKDYIFGLEPKAKAIGRFNGQELTLFTSTFYGCGSGSLTNFSLLTVNGGEFENLLPKVQLTDQSEYKVWNLPGFSRLPVVVTADFVWDFEAHETHFARHRYSVYVYVYDPKTGKCAEQTHYVTSKRYPGLDESALVHILDAEKPTIIANLSRVRLPD